MKIVIVIPAYNEQTQIVSIIKSIQKLYTHIVIVDDGSADDTYGEAVSHGGVTVCRHIVNRGQGAALKTGTQMAIELGADIIVHFDADGQMQPEDIATVIKPIELDSADVVLGSRFMGIESNIPPVRRVVLGAAKVFTRFFIGGVLTDPQSGFRALSRHAAESIEITQDRMAHCSEIQHEVFKKNLRLQEVPVKIIYTEYSRSRGQRSTNAIKIVWDLFIQRLLRSR